jgi:hypothetical protein
VPSPPVSDQRVFKPEIKTNQPGKEYELVVGLVPPMTTSNIAGSITIRTSSTNTPLLTVTAVATIQPPVAALPAQLVLLAGPMATKRQLGVYVRNNESTPITVSEPSISLTNVQVQLQEFQKGRVVCDFPENFELAPGERGLLTVKTSNPQVPVLQIPIIVRAAGTLAGQRARATHFLRGPGPHPHKSAVVGASRLLGTTNSAQGLGRATKLT